MEQHQITDLLKTSLSNLENLVDVNIIIGDTISLEDAKIVPISKVKCGFISGGFDQKKQKLENEPYPFGGGTGGNVTLTPVAFLVYHHNEIKLLHVNDNTYLFDKLIDLIKSVKNKQNSLIQVKK